MQQTEVLVFGFLILSFQVSQAAVIVEDPSSETYQWKAGPWSACEKRTKCGEGHKIRKVWCVNSLGYRVSNSNCNGSLKPPTMKQCFTVCDHHKFVLRWKVGHWSPCIAKTSSQCKGVSLTGEAHRSVECVLSSTHLVVDNEACEYFWDKPDSEMSCSLDCPLDCVLVKKNVTCHSRQCSKQSIWNEEVNDMLVAPSDGSSSCSDFVTQPVCKEEVTEACKSSKKSGSIFKIKIGPWSPCTSESDQSEESVKEIMLSLSPVQGISRRNISCINETGSEVNLGFCAPVAKPALMRRCVVPIHCVVSPWSEWHVQEEGCVASDGQIYAETRIRRRRLLQMPVGAGASPCPPLFEERVVEVGLPSCNKYQWYPLEWTDCQVLMHGNHREVTILKPTCGSGLQYRNLTCLRMSDMVPVDRNMCKDSQPVTVQRCKVPCKRDCQVSHWARWEPCMPFNNSDFMNNIDSGYRHRVRSVLVSPSNGGKPCPHLEELDKCQSIEIFNWQYGNWSDCALSDPHATCGPGKRTRDFTCVNYDGVPMSSFMCDHHIPLLETTSTCRVPCPNDCIMSEWSQWSECSRSCSTPKAEGLFHRNRTLLAIAGEGGKPCRKKKREGEYCNLYSCDLYKWTTSVWGPCTPVKSEAVGQTLCGLGVQKREVKCMKGDDDTKPLKMCRYSKKPESERDCHLPCPVDCVVSNFTEWSSCDGSCDSDMVQFRHRIILQSSKYGGKSCPDALTEARPCSAALEPHCLTASNKIWGNITYHWNYDVWSDCQLPLENQACGMGFQIRDVTCMDSANRTVEPHFCLPTVWRSLPDGLITTLPSSLRSCEVVCSSNCTVSTWSPWSRCNYSYQAKRSRRRELVGLSESNSECLKKIKLLEEELCPVIPTNLTLAINDRWMSCIVEDENRTTVTVNGQLVKRDCGEGYRYKVGNQINSENDVELGTERDFCLTDCPLDCQMSPWSEWTQCNVPCGQGFRERKRHVIVHSNLLGRPCPEKVNKTEIQRDVCNVICMDYHWLAGGWTECQLEDPETSCGIGTHYRSVRCLDKRTERETEESRCDPLQKPASMEPCRVFCPGECVVSEWQVSKKCTEPCSNTTFQELRRTIYRHPNATANPCPSLVMKLPCVLNSTCHHHDWVLGPWGSCVLPEGAHCGEGVLKRPLICLRSDGRQVDPIQCEKTHKSLSLQEPISKPCYIDCPVDCVLSEWSAWNKSSCSACGPRGIMTRNRRILQPSSDAGQPCSTELEQRKPCDFKPCYHWKHSEWSQCDLEGATCGYGVRRRVVECIRFDHLKVDKAHCLVVNITFPVNAWLDPAWLASAQEDSHEEELCHVPCPEDCVMTQWSTWSHCQKNCRIGQKVGYQTSSRHILYRGSSDSIKSCPKQLWRTKPCWSDNCDMFAWKLRNGSYICETKDGLAVQGGCASEPRPCFPTCEKLGGKCESSMGVCYCENDKGERTILGPTSRRCRMIGKGPRPPANHSAPTPEIRLKYYPDDSQVSFWMYAMISIGTAFVIFVAVTVYLMCRSSLRQRTVSVERQPSVRRRLNGGATDHSTLESSPDVRSHCSH